MDEYCKITAGKTIHVDSSQPFEPVQCSFDDQNQLNIDTRNNGIFIPQSVNDISTESVWKFYKNIFTEIKHCAFSEKELEKIFDYHAGFGNIAARHFEHLYYKQQFCSPLSREVKRAFNSFKKPIVLDLCCGVGMQSILFALLGATKVVAVDIDKLKLSAFRKRLDYYNSLLTKPLEIEILEADVLQQCLSKYGKFDVVYSHFGIGYLLPAEKIFEKLGVCVNSGGLILLEQANPEYILSIFLRKIPVSPRKDFIRHAARFGFEVFSLRGLASFPRPLWRIGGLMKHLDEVVCHISPLNIGLEYAFKKVI
jgi:SAM-dependent methyltransferase